jgi:hypothetical protein
LLLPLGFVQSAEAEKPQQKEAALRVLVDPRVELMSIIFRLAGNPEYQQGRVKAYVEDVERWFGKSREHRVVKLARELRRSRGVSYDAVMSMAVHLDNTRNLQLRVPLEPWPAGLDGRWPRQRVPEFLEAAREFAQQADFPGFLVKHQPLYEMSVSRMRAVLEKDAHLEWFDEFFGRRPKAAFTVALGLLNGGGSYGLHCRTPDGQEDLYCVLGVWLIDDEGKPRFTRDVLDVVVHEFCHSYTNAIVERHANQLQTAGEKIFPHVAKTMRAQAYSNWKTIMYESLVRASVLRYIQRYDGRIAAGLAKAQQWGRGFRWVGELSDLLGEYEAQRDKYKTLEDFAPRIVEFLNSYADRFPREQELEDAKRPRIVSITPANGAIDVDPDLRKIEVIFDRPMRDGSWSMIGGGPNFPELTGKASYDAKRTTWSIPVKLKPAWTYQFMLNSPTLNAFRSADGTPLAPVKVTFKTARKSAPAAPPQ